MNEKLKYCIGIVAIYVEVLVVVALGTNVDLLSIVFTSDNMFLDLILPKTVANLIGIPFFIWGFFVTRDRAEEGSLGEIHG